MTSRERASEPGRTLSEFRNTQNVEQGCLVSGEYWKCAKREGTGFSRTGGVNDSTNVLDTWNDSPGCAAGAFEPTTTPVLLWVYRILCSRRMSSSGHGPGRRHHSNTRAGCVILNLNNSRPFDSIHFPFSLSLGRPFGRSFGPMKSKQLFVTFYVPPLLVFFSHTSPIQGGIKTVISKREYSILCVLFKYLAQTLEEDGKGSWVDARPNSISLPPLPFPCFPWILHIHLFLCHCCWEWVDGWLVGWLVDGQNYNSLSFIPTTLQ